MSGRRPGRRDKFCVGQRVVWKMDVGDKTATVISQRLWATDIKTKRGVFVYWMDVDELGKCNKFGVGYGAPERELRPLYDGDQAGSWEEVERLCGWRPERADLKVPSR